MMFKNDSASKYVLVTALLLTSAFTSHAAPDTQLCPKQFNKVLILANGKMCQIFAADYPASMVYFVPRPQQSVVNSYLAQDDFSHVQHSKKRMILKSTDNNTTLIISPDGDGTQVDILVKAPLSLAKN